jgi:hypothetical protein
LERRAVFHSTSARKLCAFSPVVVRSTTVWQAFKAIGQIKQSAAAMVVAQSEKRRKCLLQRH